MSDRLSVCLLACLLACLMAAVAPALAQQPLPPQPRDPQFRPGMPMPEGPMPGGSMPGGSMPSGSMPRGPVPDDGMPNGRMPDGRPGGGPGQSFGPMPQDRPQPGFGPPPPPMPDGDPRGLRGDGLPQIVPLMPAGPDPQETGAAEPPPAAASPADATAAPATPASQAPAPDIATIAAPPPVDVTSGGSPWALAGLAAVLGLVVFGWWSARRRSHELALETQQLTRQQMLLKSAHLTLKAQSERLREQSILDPLTGVLNRQAFGNELREMSGHLAGYNRPLNLLVFDLDHFKRINDQQGHLAGDAALKLVVGIVREHLVSADLFGRFGGDEFLIACADQPLASCQALAEQVRAAVEKRAKTHAPPLPGLTLSMGLAQADADSGYNAEALFARADAALYEAKRRGRNCVVVADGSLPMPPAASTTQRHL